MRNFDWGYILDGDICSCYWEEPEDPPILDCDLPEGDYQAPLFDTTVFNPWEKERNLVFCFTTFLKVKGSNMNIRTYLAIPLCEVITSYDDLDYWVWKKFLGVMVPLLEKNGVDSQSLIDFANSWKECRSNITTVIQIYIVKLLRADAIDLFIHLYGDDVEEDDFLSDFDDP